jgi:demethylmenaquinone methyltransferase/2-methoxy-6-polyprenyl-1,4-benzoquinol methylase
LSKLSGLGKSYWGEVIGILRSIIPVYDKVNRAISLGKDSEYRHRGIQGRIFPGNTVLDAGSGYGNMSQVALGEAQGNANIVMYDPIPEMLMNARAYLGAPAFLSTGIFEYMPFRDGTFDAILCGYSLRDAIYLSQAIAEMYRVLKDGGRLIIVDLGKPDCRVTRAMVSFYLKYILGILAFAAAGKTGLKFRTLYGTYLRWPKNSELYAMLRDKFSRIEFDKPMMGGAIIVAAYK